MKTDAEIRQYVINKFMGRKINCSNWNDLMAVIKKVEEQTNNGKKDGLPLKTFLERLDSDNKNIPKHVFGIMFNESTKYKVESISKEYCVIMSLCDYCKDWLISQQMKNK